MCQVQARPDRPFYDIFLAGHNNDAASRRMSLGAHIKFRPGAARLCCLKMADCLLLFVHGQRRRNSKTTKRPKERPGKVLDRVLCCRVWLGLGRRCGVVDHHGGQKRLVDRRSCVRWNGKTVTSIYNNSPQGNSEDFFFMQNENVWHGVVADLWGRHRGVGEPSLGSSASTQEQAPATDDGWQFRRHMLRSSLRKGT